MCSIIKNKISEDNYDTHKGWDFRDDYTEFVLSVFYYLGFSTAENLWDSGRLYSLILCG